MPLIEVMRAGFNLVTYLSFAEHQGTDYCAQR
jgi:hypothetical protein